MVTIHEFRTAVWEKFDHMSRMKDKEAFFSTKAVQNEIGDRYYSNLKRVKKGYLDEKTFLDGVAGSVAYSLLMLNPRNE